MTQKRMAVECLAELNVDYSFIESFMDKGQVMFFESYMGDDVSNYPDVAQKIKEVESEYGCLVYAATYTSFHFGECYSFLVVSKYEEDWEHCLRRIDDCTFSAFAYVWNKTDDRCSEFGFITVDADLGGILRLG